MCGIVGAVRIGSNGQQHSGIESEWLGRALSVLVHRGPDAEGRFERGNVYFGSRRLRIHDISPNAEQPFYNKDQTKLVVFNGAIFNFKNLRKELSDIGYVFETNSDTEVVLFAIMAWGVDAFKRFSFNEHLVTQAEPLQDLRVGALCRDEVWAETSCYVYTKRQIPPRICSGTPLDEMT